MGITIASVVTGFHRAGILIRDIHVCARSSEAWGSTVEFEMRLNRFYAPLPARQWLAAQDRSGKVARGSLEGASFLLFGRITELIDGGSASVRIVDASTSVIKAVTTALVKEKTWFRAAQALEQALRDLMKRYGIRFAMPTDGRVR